MQAAMMMAVGILLAAAPPDDATPLEGTWLVVNVEIEGKPLPPEAVKKRSETLTFKGDTVTIRNARPQEKSTGFKVDPSASPKALDINGPGNDPAKGRKFLYELKGDTLTLCQGKVGSVRPTAFPTPAKQDAMVMTLTRQKP